MSTNSTQTTGQSDQQLDKLRNRLERRLDYTDDNDLRHEIREWMRRSHDLPAADVEEHLETKIGELTAEHKMFAHDGVESGTAAFPDTCEPCPHYGGGCPIATLRVVEDEIDRIADESDSASEFRRGVRGLASDYECHMIPQWLSEWANRYEGVVTDGMDLDERLDADIYKMESPGAKQRVDFREREDE